MADQDDREGDEDLQPRFRCELRRTRREVVENMRDLEALIPVMADLWEQDKNSGHVRVISQMIAGAVNRPELTERVVALMEPWVALAQETVRRVLPPLVPAEEAADAIVTLLPLLSASAGSPGRPETSPDPASAT